MTHPQVVVVSAAPMSDPGATGITLSNIFAGWPADRLSLVHFDPDPAPPVRSAYRLRAGLSVGPLRVPDRLTGLLAGSSRRALRSSVPGEISSVSSTAGPPSPRRRAVRSARVITDALGGGLTPELLAFLDERPPEVVYSVLGSLTVTRAARLIAQHYGVPLVPHFMDDWPSTRYADGALFGVGRTLVGRAVAAVVRRAPVGLAISDAMAREYEQRFGGSFEVVMNTVAERDFAAEVTVRPTRTGLRYLYVGGLHLGRVDPLLALAPLLAAADPTSRLVLHTSAADHQRHRRRIEATPGVEHGGHLPPGAVAAALSAADVLVHVESFDPDYAAYTRLSVSTKIPQYMAAARPILAICPPGLASGRYVGSTGAGIAVPSASPESLGEAVARLADPDQRHRLADAGWRTAHAEHAQPTVCRRLASLLAAAARGGSGAPQRPSPSVGGRR